MVEKIIQISRANLKSIRRLGNRPVETLADALEQQLRWLIEAAINAPRPAPVLSPQRSPLKICLYLEGEHFFEKSGFLTAFRQHSRAIRLAGLTVSFNPDREDYDLLHLHAFGPMSLYYLRRARLIKKPVIVHAHTVGAHDFRDSYTMSNLVSPLYERYLRLFYQTADAILTPTRFAQKALRSQGITKPIFVVSNGVDVDRFRERPRPFSARQFTVFSAGNVIPRKGVTDFVAVARRLPQLRFIWYGQVWPRLFTLWPSLIKAIDERPVNVRFAGFTENPQRDYQKADLLFFPSRTETQGLVILEAAALGKPIIVRDIPEYSDWLIPGVNCLKGRTNGEFVRLIRQVISQPELYQKLSAGALALSREHRLAKVGQKLKFLYENIAAGAGILTENAFGPPRSLSSAEDLLPVPLNARSAPAPPEFSD